MNHGLSHESPTPRFARSWRGKIPFFCMAFWLEGAADTPHLLKLLTKRTWRGAEERPLPFHTPAHISGGLRGFPCTAVFWS